VKSLLLIFILILSLGLDAHNDKSRTAKPVSKVITGQVINHWGETVPGAEIRITETGETCYADLDGRFSLNVKTDKAYNISVYTIGYVPVNVMSDLLPTFSNFSLKPL
jgi:hypothetical protein